MALTRKAPAAAGIGLLALAALVVASPAVADLIPTAAVVDWLGNDYLLLAAVAALALVGLVSVLLVRTVAGVAEATPPPVEGTTPVAPGRSVDESIDALPPLRVTEGHRRVRERLRTAAVAAVAEADGSSRPAACDRIESGDWTEDATAAAFVADDEFDPPTVRRRVAARLRRDDWFRRRVDATLSALERLEGDPT